MTKILNIPPKEIKDENNNINVKGTAIYSKDETNRYSLEIDILSCKNENMLTVIMFNPSEYGKNNNGIFVDQTITNIIKIANDTGYGHIKILNLFTAINSKQKEIPKDKLININFLKQKIEESTDILVAWGKEGNSHINRTQDYKEIKEILAQKNIYTFCRNNRKQYPKHPARIDVNCCRNCYGRCEKFTLEKFVLK